MSMLTSHELSALVIDQVDSRRNAVGMVVGVEGPTGRSIAAHGLAAIGGEHQVAADTVFGIASVTKIFTSILLADMVRSSEVALDDPVERHLPAGVRVPRWNSRQVTL